MRHIHGGSILLEHLRTAGLPGGFLEWGEVLCQGPTPGGLAPDAWSAMRGAFLGVDPERLAAQDRTLDESAAGEDELVLWFGPELFCQAILIALLARLDALPHRRARLSLVCIGSYPGVDDHRSCTVSHLDAAQLREVYAERPEVTREQLDAARRAWDAWCAPDPTDLARLTRTPLPSLPFLQAALLRHVEEFPAQGTGLSRTESQVLDALAGTEMTFGELFSAAQRTEQRRWLTDSMLQELLRDLSRASLPLVTNAEQRFRVTDAGRAVLAGTKDAVALNGIDRWIGGVHLTSPPGQGVRIWRREPQTGTLRRD